MIIVEGKKENFSELIKEDLVLVDFYATWCGPCKMLKIVIEELMNLNINVKVVEIDVDKEETLASQYGIRSVPTLLLFKRNLLVKEHHGFLPKEMLIDFINN